MLEDEGPLDQPVRGGDDTVLAPEVDDVLCGGEGGEGDLPLTQQAPHCPSHISPPESYPQPR